MLVPGDVVFLKINSELVEPVTIAELRYPQSSAGKMPIDVRVCGIGDWLPFCRLRYNLDIVLSRRVPGNRVTLSEWCKSFPGKLKVE